jgi:hypothetical protein
VREREAQRGRTKSNFIMIFLCVENKKKEIEKFVRFSIQIHFNERQQKYFHLIEYDFPVVKSE